MKQEDIVTVPILLDFDNTKQVGSVTIDRTVIKDDDYILTIGGIVHRWAGDRAAEFELFAFSPISVQCHSSFPAKTINDAELEAENARLAQEVQRLGQDNNHLRQTINTLLSESASLRQRVRGTDISVHHHFIP